MPPTLFVPDEATPVLEVDGHCSSELSIAVRSADGKNYSTQAADWSFYCEARSSEASALGTAESSPSRSASRSCDHEQVKERRIGGRRSGILRSLSGRYTTHRPGEEQAMGVPRLR